MFDSGDFVVVWGDGGAEQHAARRPVLGRHRAAMFIKGIVAKRERMHRTTDVRHARINGDPGLVVYGDGELFMTMAFELQPDGIAVIRSVLNPDKLAHLR